MGYDTKIIDFEKTKEKLLTKKLLLEHKKDLTRIALTSNSQTEYAMMDTMYKIVESSHKIAKDPILRKKHRRLLRGK